MAWKNETALPFAITAALHFSPIVAGIVYLMDEGTNFYKYNLTTGIYTQLTAPNYSAVNCNSTLTLSPDGLKLSTFTDRDGSLVNNSARRIEIYTIATDTWVASAQAPNLTTGATTARVNAAVWIDNDSLYIWAHRTTSRRGAIKKYVISTTTWSEPGADHNPGVSSGLGEKMAMNATDVYIGGVGTLVLYYTKWNIVGNTYTPVMTTFSFVDGGYDRDKLWYHHTTTFRQGYVNTADDSQNSNQFVENTDRAAGLGSSFGVSGEGAKIIAYALNVTPWIMSVGGAISTGAPSVTTQDATDVDKTTATGNGNVTSLGIPLATRFGHCWATHVLPTTVDNITTGVPVATGVFTSSITGLKQFTKYWMRAYITSPMGTFYGQQVEFLTLTGAPIVTTDLVTEIGVETALGNGSMDNNGGSTIVAHGVTWNTGGTPNINDDSLTDEGSLPFNFTGDFTSLMTVLTASTTYKVRAYATNAEGLTGYGEEKTFVTNAVGAPIVTTQEATNISGTTALGNGTIVDFGASDVTEHGVCWSTSESPTTSDSKTTEGTGTVGAFSSIVTGLGAATKYFMRAYATNSQGTAYGNNVTIREEVGELSGNIANKREYLVYTDWKGQQRALLGVPF